MAREKLSLGFITRLLCKIVVCSGSRDSTIWNGVKRGIVASTWCIASPVAADDKLQAAITQYCDQPGVDCSVIKPGGACYQPNTVKEHASLILDLYYKAHNAISPYCPSDVGFVSLTDPSGGSCKYA